MSSPRLLSSSSCFVSAVLAGCLTACLAEPPPVDLDGPEVVASSLDGAGRVDVPVWPALEVELSEPLDPATIHPGSVALVAWELSEDRCELAPSCVEGACVRGRCQVDPLGAGQLSALERGELDILGDDGDSLVAVELELAPGRAGPGTRLIVRPRRPLASFRRHSLVLGPGLRDEGGAPLVDEWGRVVTWRREFVSAGPGSSGPEPELVAPAPGQAEVPTNLAAVETWLWPPVPTPARGAKLWLEADDGGAGLDLVEPSACVGYVPGTCLRWRPDAGLRAGVRYRVAGGSVRDRLGRPAIRPGPTRETWFRVGSGPDEEPPHAELSPRWRGRCLSVWVDAGEPVHATFAVAGRVRTSTLAGPGYLGVALGPELGLSPGDPVEWTLELRDLAANTHGAEGVIAAGSSFALVPDLRITEILANPAGPEPDAEFIELLAGPDGADLDGLFLIDGDLAQLGPEPGGDPLPSLSLGPNEVAVLVGPDWIPDNGLDAPLAPGARVLHLDDSLGRSGLTNAGEPLTVWTRTQLGITAVASYGNWIDTSASRHGGRSLVGGPDACDLPDRWRSHPLGRSTPGSLP